MSAVVEDVRRRARMALAARNPMEVERARKPARVRTPAGVRRYKQPIGTLIVPNVLDNLKSWLRGGRRGPDPLADVQSQADVDQLARELGLPPGSSASTVKAAAVRQFAEQASAQKAAKAAKKAAPSKSAQAAEQRRRRAESFAQRYERGESISQIAASEGVAYSTVHSMLTKDAGIQLRPRGGRKAAKAPAKKAAPAKAAPGKAAQDVREPNRSTTPRRQEGSGDGEGGVARQSDYRRGLDQGLSPRDASAFAAWARDNPGKSVADWRAQRRDRDQRQTQVSASDVRERLGRIVAEHTAPGASIVGGEGEARQYLESLKLTTPQWRQLARDLGVPIYANASQATIRDSIVKTNVRSALSAHAIRTYGEDDSGTELERLTQWVRRREQ